MLNKLFTAAILLCGMSCQAQQKSEEMKDNFTVKKTEKEWQAELNPLQFQVLRQAATERPGTGEYYLHHEDGTYTCAGCGNPLFKSDNKFDSGCGWPSFDRAVAEGSVIERVDHSHCMVRTEIICANCGGHLGHVFNDGPKETTGMRYCINSAALRFKQEE